MKAILKFNLDDIDDRMAHKRAIDSLDMAIAIFEFKHNFWRQFEYLDLGKEAQETLELVKEKQEDLLIDIDIDKLIN